MSRLLTICCALILLWAVSLIPATNGLQEDSLNPENVSQEVVNRVANKIDALEAHWEALNQECDRRAAFALGLLITTRKIKNGIDQNRFTNGTGVAIILTDLIDAYNESITNRENNNNLDISKPFKKAFKWLETNQSTPIQDLFLGTNALINFELAFILNNTGFCCDEENHNDLKRFREMAEDVQQQIANEFCHRYDPSMCLVTEFTLTVINPSQLHFIHRWFNVAWNEAEQFAAAISI